MFKKIAVLMLALTMIFTLFSCSTSGGTVPEENIYSTVEKIGELNLKEDPFIKTKPSRYTNYLGYGGGIAYTVGQGAKKGGVVSLDGDTGIYENFGYGAYYNPVYHKVSSVELTDPSLECVNTFGLIDGMGKEIIPQEYADIVVLSGRYAKVIKATEVTDNSEDALVTQYIKTSAFSKGEQFSYNGVWYIYDMQNGRLLENVSGTDKYSNISVQGQFIEYTPKGASILGGANYFDSSGSPVNMDVTDIFEDGSYSVDSGYGRRVYDADGDFLFSCSSSGYIPFKRNEGCDRFIAKKTVGLKTVYAVMDLNGNVISIDFEEMILCAVGNLLINSDGEICNFNGVKVIEGEFDRISFDKRSDCYWLNEAQGDYDEEDIMIDEYGNVLFTDADNDVYFDNYYPFAVRKSTDEFYNLYYCYAEKDFTIQGYDSCNWLVRNESEIIDTVTGETLISGYLGYEFSAYDEDTIYIYAMKNKNYVYDVYVINYSE